MFAVAVGAECLEVFVTYCDNTLCLIDVATSKILLFPLLKSKYTEGIVYLCFCGWLGFLKKLLTVDLMV